MEGTNLAYEIYWNRHFGGNKEWHMRPVYNDYNFLHTSTFEDTAKPGYKETAKFVCYNHWIIAAFWFDHLNNLKR